MAILVAQIGISSLILICYYLISTDLNRIERKIDRLLK
jgi:hypothetical protein